MSVIRILMQSLVDYAGLFPPAGLDMAESVRNYAEYRAGEHRWALGKFVVPASRLGEFDAAAKGLLSAADPWPLSVLGGGDPAADLAAVRSFSSKQPGARIVSLEVKTSTMEEIRSAAAAIGGALETFYEIPIVEHPQPLLEALRAAGGRAKARTGGVQAGMFPSAFELARFLQACAAAPVPFKATAGLHHPLRCVRPFTYAADSPSGPMHGFLNVFLAAAWVRSAMDVADAVLILEEGAAGAFRFDDDGIRWKQRFVDRDSLSAARRDFALSFGSCSFREPIDELKGMGLL